MKAFRKAIPRSARTPRSHIRIAVNLPIQISLDNKTVPITMLSGLIVNLSRGGACIKLDSELPMKAFVTLHWKDKNESYQVRVYTRWKEQLDNQWRVGVEVMEKSSVWLKLLYFACQVNSI
ncbi:MAG: PilZ domain-containing protein [Acidobacteriota bacterium]